MTISFIRVAPPNSVILLMDPKVGEVPPSMRGNLVATTASCIAIGCLSEHDGPTDFYFPANEPDPKQMIVFEGYIETPGRYLAICNVMLEELLSTETSQPHTWVQVWVNDPREPNDIRIVLRE